MRVSVLIVSWNARDWLARCLRALARHATRDHRRRQRLDRRQRRAGAARLPSRPPRRLAAQPGVCRRREPRASIGDRPAPPAAQPRHRGASRRDRPAGGRARAAMPDVGAAVAGRLVNADGSPQSGFNVRRFPTLASLAVDLLLLDHLWPDNPVTARYYARDLDPDSSADVEQPAAACLMVRAEVFDRLGGHGRALLPGLVRGRGLLPPHPERRALASATSRPRRSSIAAASPATRSARRRSRGRSTPTCSVTCTSTTARVAAAVIRGLILLGGDCHARPRPPNPRLDSLRPCFG